MSTHLDHLETVREYAMIVRGEHPAWEGDRVRNGESFAFRIGHDFDDALELVRSLGIHENDYVEETGLPRGSLWRLAAGLKAGARARKD